MPGYLRRARREPTLLRLDDADVVDPCAGCISCHAHHTLPSSRPEGVNKALFGSFVIFDLKPLSEEQQQQAVESQLALIPYKRSS